MALIPSSSTNNAHLHDKLEELRQMMQRLKIKANDIQNEVRNEELHARKKTKSEVTLWLEQVSIIEEQIRRIGTEVAQVSFFRRGQLLDRLEGMMQCIEQLLKQSEFPRGLMLGDFKFEGLELVTEKLEGSTPLRTQQEVWSCFESGETRVAIFGVGGVGKTSLAMHINNKILQQKHLFKHVYYVTMSRDTSVFKLQGDIAKVFGHRLEYEDEPKRAAELREALAMRQGSLLILDDVWEDIIMEEVGISVEGDGCKLLITTRIRDVCSKMKCFPVKMDPLSTPESWYLFKKQLGDFETLEDEVKNTARLVAKECDGLPLGIVTMARSMRGVTSVHVWRDALKRLRNPCSSPHDMKNKVFRILRFSYDRLYDDKHKKCFLYCALYPEDYAINRNGLIRQFIAVGLIDGANRRERIDEGHSLLNDLENASLLECVAIKGYGRHVKMHDLVRDMSINIIGSTGIVIPGKGLKELPAGEKEWTNKDLQWVSLMHNLLDRIEGMIPDFPHISVLFLENNPIVAVSDSFFVRMIGLRVLNLSDTQLEVLPASVSNLCNLKTLLLCSCKRLHYIPSLAKLTKLRILDLGSCREMRTLPEGMEELSSLEHLNLKHTRIKGMCRGVFIKLLNLESFLSNYKIIVPPEELRSLGHLEKLIRVHFDDVSGFSRCVGFGYFSHWKTYSVNVGNADFSLDDPYRRRLVDNYWLGDVFWGGEDFVEDGSIDRNRVQIWRLSVPRNVHRLELKECRFDVGSLLDALPSLIDATELECCALFNCTGIEYMIPEGRTKPLEVESIRELYLTNLPEFGGLTREELVHPQISFSMLVLKNCPKLKKLWLLNLDLPILEKIDLSYCGHMEVIFATEMGETVELPKLRCLNLRECPMVKKIGLESRNLPSLETISIWYCQALEEIVATETEEIVELPKLRCLELSYLPELRSIWGGCNLPSLEVIDIKNCKQMEEIFAGDDEIQMPNLTRFNLWELPKLRRISRETVVCGSLYSILIAATGVLNLENFPISIPWLLSINKDAPLPAWTACDVPRGWWDSLHWNDPATQAFLRQHASSFYQSSLALLHVQLGWTQALIYISIIPSHSPLFIYSTSNISPFFPTTASQTHCNNILFGETQRFSLNQWEIHFSVSFFKLSNKNKCPSQDSSL